MIAWTSKLPSSTLATFSMRASSTQLVLSRWTRTFLPITKAMFQPTIHINVKAIITKKRMRGEAYHNHCAQCLPPVRPVQTIRVQTACGFDSLASVESPAPQPNSYIITPQRTRSSGITDTSSRLISPHRPTLEMTCHKCPSQQHLIQKLSSDTPPLISPAVKPDITSGDSGGNLW